MQECQGNCPGLDTTATIMKLSTCILRSNFMHIISLTKPVVDGFPKDDLPHMFGGPVTSVSYEATFVTPCETTLDLALSRRHPSNEARVGQREGRAHVLQPSARTSVS